MILVTGFEPFDGLARNPTGELARAVHGGDVRGAVLPVDHARIAPVLEELLASEPFAAILLLGVAVMRPAVSLERVAINFRDGHRRDNAGVVPESSEVVAGGPEAYFSTLPLEALHDDLAAAELPVEISLSAGAYLCNASFYLARHATDGRGIPCGFVHMPPTPDMDAPAESLPFEEQLRAIHLILNRLGTV